MGSFISFIANTLTFTAVSSNKEKPASSLPDQQILDRSVQKEPRSVKIDWEDTLPTIMAYEKPTTSPGSIFENQQALHFIEEDEQNIDQISQSPQSEMDRKLDFLAQKNKELHAELEAIYFFWHSTLNENEKLYSVIKTKQNHPHLGQVISK